VVPFAPGASDVQIRALAPLISAKLGQPIIIDNMPGGGGVIAANAVKLAKPDGYTLFFTGMATLTMVPSLRKDISYSLKDFAPLGNISSITGVMIVHPSNNYKNLKELIQYARDNPGKLNYGTPGIGTAGHTFGVGPQVYGDFLLTHIPYKGGSQLLQDLVAGQVDFTVTALGPVEQQVKGGQLRIIGVTGSKRNQFIPEIKTVAESGLPNFSMTGNHFLAAPANTPKPILEKLNQSVMQIMANKDMQERWNKMGLETGYTSILATKTLLQTETEFYGKLITELNLSASD
jgi:tripartite-type tricarboxylate transporter receptor subunit TctC